MKKTGNNLIPLQDICGVALLYYIGCLMISVGENKVYKLACDVDQ